jgi:hypothetical protein
MATDKSVSARISKIALAKAKQIMELDPLNYTSLTQVYDKAIDSELKRVKKKQ